MGWREGRRERGREREREGGGGSEGRGSGIKWGMAERTEARGAMRFQWVGGSSAALPAREAADVGPLIETSCLSATCRLPWKPWSAKHGSAMLRRGACLATVAAPCSAVVCAVWCSAAQRSAAQCSAVQCPAAHFLSSGHHTRIRRPTSWWGSSGAAAEEAGAEALEDAPWRKGGWRGEEGWAVEGEGERRSGVGVREG